LDKGENGNTELNLPRGKEAQRVQPKKEKWKGKRKENAWSGCRKINSMVGGKVTAMIMEGGKRSHQGGRTERGRRNCLGGL